MVVVGEKSYKHIDEGPIRIVRRTRSPTANADDSSASDNEGRNLFFKLGMKETVFFDITERTHYKTGVSLYLFDFSILSLFI